MKTLLLKALGVKGIWVWIVQIVIEMLSAQDEIVSEPGAVELGQVIPKESKGALRLQRVLDRLRKALSKVLKLDVYWPAIKDAAEKAISANKALYNALRDAFDAAKAAK